MPKYNEITIEIDQFTMDTHIAEPDTYIRCTSKGKAIMTIKKINKEEVEINVNFRTTNLEISNHIKRLLTDGNTL